MKKSLFLFSFLLLCIIGSAFLFFHSKFNISQIEVKNNNFIQKKALDKICSDYYTKNIFKTLLTQSLSKKLLSSFPYLASLKLKIILPDSIIIFLKEKEPFCTIVSPEKNLLISKDGTILNKETKDYTLPNLDDILIVHGINENLLTKTTIPFELQQKIKIISNALNKTFPNNTFNIEFTKLDLNDIQNGYDKIILFSNDILPIKIGNLENLNAKIKQLKDFLKSYDFNNGKNISYLDLRVNNRVIVKYEK
ncbi:cell division protein FtsQ/DivIB [Candidatus Margulisiibacteriota bacterium]